LPIYKYLCGECKHSQMESLPISFDPQKKLHCPECKEDAMERRIIASEFPRKVGKVWAGDWFEKTYGHDVGEDAQRRVDKKEELEKERKELEDLGVRINFKSRQVGDENRISIKGNKGEDS